MFKSKRTRWVPAASVVGVSFLVASASRALAAPGDIFNLGVLAGDTDSGGAGVNDAGQVTGVSSNDSTERGFLYTGTPGRGGAMYDLGTNNIPRAINASGQVTGGSPTGTGPHAFIYTGIPGHGGVMADLDTLSGTSNSTYGFAINAPGQVAGSAEDLRTSLEHAFLYTGSQSGGKMIDLGTLGGTYSEGLGINDAGQVVGDSHPNGSSYNHAFLYTGTPGSGGAMHDLGILGGHNSRSLAINDVGQVVGWSDTKIPAAGGGYYSHAFLYTGSPGSGGAMHDLGTLPGALQSQASAINNEGVVVGFTDQGADRAFVYTGTPGEDGHMIDLNTWLQATNPAAAARWTLTGAGGISDTGLITGTGIYDDGTGGVQRAFLLDASSIAVPEPCGPAALLLPMFLRRRRARTTLSKSDQ